jgi:hypothetical protein
MTRCTRCRVEGRIPPKRRDGLGRLPRSVTHLRGFTLDFVHVGARMESGQVDGCSQSPDDLKLWFCSGESTWMPHSRFLPRMRPSRGSMSGVVGKVE